MSTADHQFHIALREPKKAEKFAEDMAELAAQISNATFKFAQEVKQAYESGSIPKRRSGDKRFSDADQVKLILGAFSFFMHVLDRHFLRMDVKSVRDAVFDFMFENLPRQVYAKSFRGLLPETENLALEHYDRWTRQLAEAPVIVGEDLEDANAAAWRAARSICEEDLGREDRRLVIILRTHLTHGLEKLSLADRAAGMTEVLCLPSTQLRRDCDAVGGVTWRQTSHAPRSDQSV
jgi:hypothetical protein